VSPINFSESQKALSYLNELRNSHTPYVRDQLQLISKQCDQRDKHIIQEALNIACLQLNLYSTAVLNRIVHQAEVVQLNGRNYHTKRTSIFEEQTVQI